MAKEGSTVSGLMDSFATAISLSLQHGVPLKVLCEKFAHTRFEPSGWTGNEHIGYAKSIMDYIFRWLQLRFLSGQQLSLFTGLGAPPAAAEGAHPWLQRIRRTRYGGEPKVGMGFTADEHQPTRGMGAASAPQGGIAPEPAGRKRQSLFPEPKSLRDRRSRHHPRRRRHAQHV